MARSRKTGMNLSLKQDSRIQIPGSGKATAETNRLAVQIQDRLHSRESRATRPSLIRPGTGPAPGTAGGSIFQAL
jgi:hypothetical protein